MVTRLERGICPYCGSRLESPQTTGKEIALTIVSALVALIALFVLYRFADHWFALRIEEMTDHMFWREPFLLWG